MMPASGNAAVVSSGNDQGRAFRSRLRKIDRIEARQPLQRLVVAEYALADGLACADHDQRNFGARRHAHLGPDRADFRNKRHDPIHFVDGLLLDKPVERRPLAETEKVVTLDAVLDHVRPKLFGDERHERMQELQDLIEHPGRHRARLGLGRIVVARQQRLDQLEIPVAELAPDELVDRRRRLVELVGFERARHRLRARSVSPMIHLLTVCVADFGSKSRCRTHSFISAKREAFHSLVAKLR